MRLQDVIPYMVCVNLAAREDRRREAWGRFAAAGLAVDRQPGVLKKTVTDPRGYKSAARYACSLAKRLAIRRAKLAGAPAVLLFEDDVVLAPDLHERLAEIELPEDWGIFFLGCKHLERPEIIAPGLVRVKRAADHHAMAVRAEYFDAAMRGMAGFGKGAARTIRYSDVKMSSIQSAVPTYAAYPNLAWQALSYSDNSNASVCAYDRHGRQTTEGHAIAGLDEEMRRWQTGDSLEPTDADLKTMVPRAAREGESTGPGESGGMVTAAPDAVGNVLRSGEGTGPLAGAGGTLPMAGGGKVARWVDDPPGWGFLDGAPARHRLEESFPLRFYINLGRREDRRAEAEWQFAVQDLEVERLVAADGRRARNTRGHGPPNKYACRLSHRMAIRQAKLRGAPAVWVFEDDVMLHPQFRRLAEALTPPPDWGVLFFGCTHVRPPEVVSPGWVKVNLLWGLQAYVVKAEWYDVLLKALRRPVLEGEEAGSDLAISRLSQDIPMYATYPNLAWQIDGFSDLTKRQRTGLFRADGHQNRLFHVVREANRGMREQILLTHGENSLGRGHGHFTPSEVFQSQPRRRDLDDFVDWCGCVGSGGRISAAAAFEGSGVTLHPGTSHAELLRKAAAAGARAAWIFEEDVIPHPRIREWLEALVLPEDWGIFYLGCVHLHAPEARALGVVKVRRAISHHSYIVAGDRLEELAERIEVGMAAGRNLDVIMVEVQGSVPCYACYPNLAWRDGSAAGADARHAFGPDGVQESDRSVLSGVERAMTELLAWRDPCGGRERKGWRISEDLVAFLRTRLGDLVGERGRLVELGPGLSTRELAARFPEASILGIEHDEKWCELLKEEFRETVQVTVRHAPLDSATGWYDLRGVELGTVDFLLVDGPPGGLGREIRAGALTLVPALGRNAVVILDDTDRSDERAAVAKWQAEGFQVLEDAGRFVVLIRAGGSG